MDATISSEREIRKISLLGRLTESLIAAENPVHFFRLLREHLLEVVPADQILIFLHDAAANKFVAPPELNDIKPADERVKNEIAYEDTVFTRLLRSRMAILRSGEDNGDRFTEAEMTIFGENVAADMSVPINATDGELLAVLHFARSNFLGYNKVQRALATAAAMFIAGVLERERLVRQASNRQEQTEWWRSRFEAFFSNALVPSCILDIKNGVVRRVNNSFATLVRMPADTLQDTSLQRLFQETSISEMGTALAELPATGDVSLRKQKLLLANGETLLVDMHFSFLAGSPREALIAFVDRRKEFIRKRIAFRQLLKLNRLFNIWKRAISEDDFHAALEVGLQKLGEAFGAKYALLCGFEDNKTQVLQAKTFVPLIDAQLSRAWAAGIAEGPYSNILAKKKIVFVPNVYDAPLFSRWRPIIKQIGYTSLLAMPLIIEDRPIGLLNLYFENKHKLYRAEKVFIKAFLKFLTLALAKGHLQDLSRQKTEQIAAIQELTQSINAIAQLEQVVKVAALVTRKVVSFDLFDITLFESDGESVRLYSVCSRQLLEKTGEQSWWPLDEHSDLGWVNIDSKTTENFHPRVENVVQSKLNVLLISKDKYLGTLEVSSMSANAYRKENEEFLTQVAGQMATAIENARLFNKLNHRVKELSALARVSLIVAEDNDIQITLPNIIQGIAKNLGTDQCSFFLEKPVQGVPDPIHVGKELISNEWQGFPGIAEKLGSKNHYVSIENLAISFPDKGKTGALLLCPVLSRRQMMGVIVAYWESPRRFARREMELVRTMANFVSTTIENERLRRESTERTEQLERANQEMEKFVFTVSHDLKSPIVSIQGFASILVDNYANALDVDARHYLERIQNNAFEMERLIKDLLELARIGRTVSVLERHSAKVIVDRALTEFSYQLKERGVKVTVFDGLPEIYCDPTQLTQVFANLIGNAIKFMDVDKDQSTIAIGARKEKDWVVFWVKDNGVGIPQAHIERVFNLFERYPHKKGIEGTGVGLTIVKRVIENHRGRIWLESQEGIGSTFFFVLPTTPTLVSKSE